MKPNHTALSCLGIAALLAFGLAGLTYDRLSTPDICAAQVLNSEDRVRDKVASAADADLLRDGATVRELQALRAALAAMDQRLNGLHPGWRTEVAEGETP